MTDNITAADRAAAESLAKDVSEESTRLLKSQGINGLFRAGNAADHFAKVIARHMQPQRAAAEKMAATIREALIYPSCCPACESNFKSALAAYEAAK